ncbi:hypothetical protein TNIN_45171 [Trichonephila inaurata madagascariensis]|uniref:Uncharacterized protein n=1 Tax=Trichonephila inaurata madagascariensis TaxID=2747483 RepID=A0A8X6MFN1_9ARAC|nr:hypothetical protein TNIN_45171 [Trichonephila inaurata madagascariensis]
MSFFGLEDVLQRALHVLYIWCYDNNMSVNTHQTTFQLFSLNGKHHDIQLHYDIKFLSRSFDTVYLGIHLDPKLTCKKHIDSSVDRGYSRSKLLKRLAGVTWSSTQNVSVQLISVISDMLLNIEMRF